MFLSELAALIQVILLDLVLAADNAVAVGLAAARLPPREQRRAILIGISGALILRIIFALMAIYLLSMPFLRIAGGALLFWVAWRLWKDVFGHVSLEAGLEAAAASDGRQRPAPTFWSALGTIILADVSMSLDNVLSVAAAARDHPTIMAFGLVFSVLLMGVGASLIARLIEKHRWLAFLGIALIVLAGFGLVWDGLHEYFPTTIPQAPRLFPAELPAALGPP